MTFQIHLYNHIIHTADQSKDTRTNKTIEEK